MALSLENSEQTPIRYPNRWAPGQSGNPGGRPKGIEQLAREHTPAAIERLVLALSDADSRVAVTAAGMLLDRGWGKPKQELSSVSDGSLTVMHLVAARQAGEELQRAYEKGGAAPTIEGEAVATIDYSEPASE